MKAPLSVLLYACLATAAFPQSFTNLNFESANVSGPGPSPFANVFPGWQAIRGGTYPSLGSTNLVLSPVAGGYHNSADLDQMTIAVYSVDASPIPGSMHPIFGTYTAYIEADLGSMHLGQLELFQSGVIPADAQSLRFRMTSYSSLTGVLPQMTLKVNGTTIPFSPAAPFWQADVSSYAGTLSEIRFVVRAEYPFAGFDPHVFMGVGLDSISFSSVPEPATAGLLLTGVLSIYILRKLKGPTVLR
jgi:hypothetical protein